MGRPTALPALLPCGDRLPEQPRQRFAERRAADAALGDDAGDVLCGVTSKAGLRIFAPTGVSVAPPTFVTSDAGRSSIGMPPPSACRDRWSRAAPRRRTESRARARGRPRCRCRSCSPCRRWRRCGRRRRRRDRRVPSRISAPAMLSVMTVVSMPSLTSSQAVSRAPWRNGRVSSASTRTALPVSAAARMTPSAVP